jgi:hypothetical protein
MSGTTPNKTLRAVDGEVDSLARAARDPVELPAGEYQELWFGLQRRPWRSLAVVPVGAAGSARDVASALCAVGQVQSHSPIPYLDVQGIDLRRVASLLEDLAIESRQADRFLLVLDPLQENLAGVPVARAADAVLLCVDLGRSDFASARRAIELVGAERVLGAVAISPGRAP